MVLSNPVKVGPTPVQYYPLTISVVGSGSVNKSPDQASYASGAVVQLSAVPASGWSFSGWSGDLSGSANPTTITIDDNKVVTATFTQNPSGDIVFEDGFETGDFSLWSGLTTTSGETATVVSAVSHDGAYSARFASSGSGGYERAYTYKSLQPMSEVFARGYFNVSTSGIADDSDRFYFVVLRAGTNNVAYAGWRRIAGVIRWSLLIRNGAGWASAFSNATPAVGEWYSVELHWVQASVNGSAELFVNGQLVCTIRNCNTATYGSVNSACFGLAELYNCGNTIIYCDSCKISKAPIGPDDP
jgi:uncharacterized repeat protein (TIGR02543 family)